MNLSNELISEFVKITNDKPKTKIETTVYGTVVEKDGENYVKFDGSDVLTPAVFAAEAINGERVVIQLKNHTATVIGNFSSPSARFDTVKLVIDSVDDLNDKIYYFVSREFFNEEIGKLVDRLNKLEGKLPGGYTALEYIESNGAQYIDTEYYPIANTRVVMDVSDFPTDAKYLFGTRSSTSTSAPYQFGMYRDSSTSIRYIYFGTYINATINDTTIRTTLSANGGTLTAYDVMASVATSTNKKCTYPLFLFALNNVGTVSDMCKARLYSCKIYDNEILVRDFVPCKNPEGLIGIYDRVNGKFYQNKGTEPFITPTK